MFCANCGKEVRARRVEFCPFCGEKLEKGDEKKARSAGASDRKLLGIPMSRRTMVIVVAAAAVVLALAILIGFHAAGLGSWKCDRCDREWFGNAYRGKYAGSVICSDCAEDYWSPKPLKDYLLDANW